MQIEGAANGGAAGSVASGDWFLKYYCQNLIGGVISVRKDLMGRYADCKE